MFRGYLEKTGILIALICMWPLAAVAEDMSLSLDEALVIGLRDNRSILLKEEDLKKAKSKIAESHAELFPSLTLTGEWTRTNNYYSKDLSQTNSQASLKQYFYTGGRIFNTIKYNGYNFEVAQALLDKEKIETALKIKEAFYTLILAQDFARLNRALLDNGREHLSYTLEKRKFGEVSDSDVLKSRSSLSDLEEIYETSLNQVSSAKESLINLLYLNKDVNISASGGISYKESDIAVDQSLLKALEERPEIKQYAAQINADRSAIEIAKANGRPSVYASWDYYSRSHAITTTVNTKDWNDYNIFGVTVSWPIFDGWKTKAKVEQAVFDLKRSQILREKSIKDITLELKDAYLGLKDALAKIKSSKEEEKLYRDNLRVVNEKYTKGELSLLDKSDAQVKYFVSEFNQVQSAYDYNIAKARFDKATGGL